MILISRKTSEAIIIDNNIEIVVIEIREDKVRLGISVPKEMPLHRGEIYDALRRHDKQSDASPETPP